MLIAVQNCEDSEAWVFRFYPKIDQATKVVIYTFSKVYVPTFRAMTQRSSCKMWIINKIRSVQTWDSFLSFKRMCTNKFENFHKGNASNFLRNFHQIQSQFSSKMPKSLIISKYAKKSFPIPFYFKIFSRSFWSY